MLVCVRASVCACVYPREHLPGRLGLVIHRLPLCREVWPHNKFPGYDTKPTDGEVPVRLELWKMRSTPSLPSIPGPLWPGVVAPHWVLSMGYLLISFFLNFYLFIYFDDIILAWRSKVQSKPQMAHPKERKKERKKEYEWLYLYQSNNSYRSSKNMKMSVTWLVGWLVGWFLWHI